VVEFRGVVNPVDPRVSGYFFRELIRLPALPNRLGGVWFAHWNGPTTEFDNEYRPLIVLQAKELRNFVIREMTDRKAVASDAVGSELKALPGMPDVV
jgi:hypothetical protein